MAKKYYLSPIRLYNEPGLGDFWGHHFQQTYSNVDFNEAGDIQTDPVTGIPVAKAILILVGAIDHTTYAADPDLIEMPEVNLDMKVSAIRGATKVLAKGRIKSVANFTDAEIDAVWQNDAGYRDVIDAYGQLNNPTFDSKNFDLNDA